MNPTTLVLAEFLDQILHAPTVAKIPMMLFAQEPLMELLNVSYHIVSVCFFLRSSMVLELTYETLNTGDNDTKKCRKPKCGQECTGPTSTQCIENYDPTSPYSCTRCCKY